MATGEGDRIMQFAPCFQVVQLLRDGMEATTACQVIALQNRFESFHLIDELLACHCDHHAPASARGLAHVLDGFGGGEYHRQYWGRLQF